MAGELINSVVLSAIKVRMAGKFLWIRTISSTIAGQFVDSTIFILVAFLGVLPTRLLVSAIISAWIFKVLYEAVATPLTYFVVGKLKRLEGIEHFDRKDNFRLW